MSATDDRPGTLILFELDGFHFALDAMKVERVVRAVEITPLPDLPPGVRGIVCVAGAAIPVLDLRVRLGLPVRDVRSTFHFIVTRCAGRLAALVVDFVADVVPAAKAAIIPAAAVLPGLATVEGWVKINGELIMIHDLEKFLSIDEMLSLEKAMKT
ncbi:MAG: chemotaxis protein CheW [Chthoniobacteraceae bacterium]